LQGSSISDKKDETRKSFGLWEISMEIIIASGKIGEDENFL